MTRLSSIVGLLRPYRGMVAGAFGSMLVVALTTAAFAWLTGPLLRLLGVSLGHNPSLTLSIPGSAWTFTTANEVAIALSLVVIGLAMVRGTAGYIQGFLVAALQQNVVRDLRTHVVESILLAEPSRYRGKPGDLATQVTADVQQIEAIISVVVAPALQNSAIVVTLLAFTVWLTPKLAFVGFIVFPVAGGLVWLANRAARRAFRTSLDRRGKLAESLVEAFSSLDVIKAFGAERAVTDRLGAHVEDVRKLTLRARRIGLLLGPTVLVGGAVMLAIIFTMGTEAVESGELSAERFASLLAALLFAYRPVQALGASVGVFAIGLAALDRLAAHWDRSPEGVLDAPSPAPITLEDVTVQIAGHTILEAISFTVSPKETVVLRGANGAGKTTLLRTLIGLEPPASGAIRVGSEVVEPRALRALFGWVPQDPVLFAGTVLENVALGAPIDRARAERALAEVGALELVSSLAEGLDTPIAVRGDSLSMGQRQLLCLARAVYRDPPFLLMDEPTSSLDAESEEELLATIGRLTGKRGVIIVTHRPRSFLPDARVIALRRGRIVEEVSAAQSQSVS